jgi:glycosyltransferase involved in cell wall biosynthesis
VTDYGSPHAGAFVPMLRTAVAGVRDRGWSATVSLPARAAQRSKEWLPAFRQELGEDLILAPDLPRRELGRWLGKVVDEDGRPTILHSHFSTFDLAVAEVARRRPQVIAVWQFHTVLENSLRARIRNRLRFTLASRHVERMLCVGPALAEEILRRGAPRDKVVHFPNGIDVDRFPADIDDDERAAARASFGLPGQATVLLHVGRDWELKGGDLFLDAFERLVEGHGGLHGLMVRGGDRAREEIARRGLDERVQVLEGIADVRRLHAASDLMLATSRGEGAVSFAILEALASGLGVVLTDIPGHALDGERPRGLRFAAVDGESIAAATADLLGREPIAVRTDGISAHQWVRDERGLERWGERLIELYEELLDGRRGARRARMGG